jgi:hypothetical protein
MCRARMLATTAVAVAAAAVGAGCGLGPGDASEGEVTLTVTRDYGSEELLDVARSDPPESETVMRMLDREAEIETRYGGGFVQSIEGISGTSESGRTHDWFFFVNGVESAIGAAETDVVGGDRIWWDHRDWTEAMRVPAVVGSWPEPFLQASAGSDRLPVRIVCAGPESPCKTAVDALAGVGVNSVVTGFGEETEGRSLRMVVGKWSKIRSDPAARLIERGPGASGVFARVAGERIELLDAKAQVARESDGLLAATRIGEAPPTWIATGTSPEGVRDAVSALDSEQLENHYGIGIADGTGVPIPVMEPAS